MSTPTLVQVDQDNNKLLTIKSMTSTRSRETRDEPSSTHSSTPSPSPSPTPQHDTRRRGLSHWLDHACLNLSPSFFSLNMGTGITSILLYNFPYPTDWLREIGIIIFVLNIIVFALLATANVVRYIRFKGLFVATLTHPVAGLFWGTLPMGFATIVNMVAYVCVPMWGYRWAQLALGLWWIDAILSVFVNLGMVFAMITHQEQSSKTLSATWLLPIVSSVVAAASGGIVANAIMPFSPSMAASTLIISYVIWGTGVPLACFIMALWLQRTITGGAPAPAALPSTFLPLGPCGQGSFGIILLGRTVRELAYLHNTGLTISPPSSTPNTTSLIMISESIYAGGLITGLILWGLGLCWYILAFAMIIDYSIRKSGRNFFTTSKFSVGFWAFTFPIGVFATSTNILAVELDSPAFRVIGAFLSVQVTVHWIWVSGMTIYKAWDGSVFVAPELGQIEGRPVNRFGRKDRDVEKQ